MVISKFSRIDDEYDKVGDTQSLNYTEFTVDFPSKPIVTEIETTFDGGVINGWKADYGIAKEKSILRAEYFTFRKFTGCDISKSSIMSVFEKMAEIQGLQYTVKVQLEVEYHKLN